MLKSPAATDDIRVCRLGDSPQRLAALCDFFQRNLSEAPLLADPSYLRWRQGSSPHGESLSQSLLVMANDRIVGHLGLMNDQLQVGSDTLHAQWLVNLVIDPQYRGGLLPLQLFRECMSHADLLLSTGAGPHMARLYQALGWDVQRDVDTYFHVLRPSRFLRMTLRKQGAIRLASWTPTLAPLDQISRVTQACKRRPRSRTDACVETKTASDASTWHFPSGEEELVQPRRFPELYHWKLDQRPVGRHHAIQISRSGSQSAFAVFKQMSSRDAAWVDIVDFASIQDHAMFARLLDQASQYARQHECDFVRVRLSDQRYKPRLRKAGWLRGTRPSDLVYFYTPRPDLKRRLATLPWSLTSLVSDRVDYGADEWK